MPDCSLLLPSHFPQTRTEIEASDSSFTDKSLIEEKTPVSNEGRGAKAIELEEENSFGRGKASAVEAELARTPRPWSMAQKLRALRF